MKGGGGERGKEAGRGEGRRQGARERPPPPPPPAPGRRGVLVLARPRPWISQEPARTLYPGQRA